MCPAIAVHHLRCALLSSFIVFSAHCHYTALSSVRTVLPCVMFTELCS